MIEPTLNYVSCQGSAAHGGEQHQMAYWEWNATGNPCHPHVVVCVHGLTRQGRDFDVLAKALSQHTRVICPDVVGRGRSDWLSNPMQYGQPQYSADMLTLLQNVHGKAAICKLDWVGTSMGGLIGMSLAGSLHMPLPVPIRKLLLNDVGPELEWAALQRIASYVGHNMLFSSEEQAIDNLQALSSGFGPHTKQQWKALCLPMLRKGPNGMFRLHYDPAIAAPMQSMTEELSRRSTEILWSVYDGIQAQTLLIRGVLSDLITAETARHMQSRGPCAQCIELEGVGHAPTLVANEQVAIARNFLLGDE